MQQHASGEYIIVTLTIKNIGNKPATITGSDFQLERGDTRYDASSVTVGAEKGFFLTKLNPGVSHTGIIVFDVPGNTAPSKYHLIVYGNGTGDHANIQLR
jgi:archaellum component FlaG (FlaF/FlaG flagellin family)